MVNKNEKVSKRSSRKRKSHMIGDNLGPVPHNSPIRKKPEVKDASSQKGENLPLSNLFNMEELKLKYPVLADEELIKKFLSVPLNNNQKGRLRQNIREDLQTASGELDPEEINRRISTILKINPMLNDSHLRKIRILHNMLKTALAKQKTVEKVEETGMEEEVESSEKLEKKDKKKNKKEKSNQRYVVFVGNLPYEISKEDIVRHFSKIEDSIRDVRIPKPKDDKKGGIAYVELKDEKSFQIALCHHHSMFANRRINVLYTTADNKVDKKLMKNKVAKMLALQKTGKLIGSAPSQKKRSFRRKRQREAIAKQKMEENQS